MGKFRDDTLYLPSLPAPPFSQEATPESFTKLQLVLELDQGHVVVIKFSNSFCIFLTDVVLGVK